MTKHVTVLFLTLCGALLLQACDRPASQVAPQPAVETTTQRPETKGLEAASLVGYDGKQVRKGVDKSLDGNDAHNLELEQALKENR